MAKPWTHIGVEMTVNRWQMVVALALAVAGACAEEKRRQPERDTQETVPEKPKSAEVKEAPVVVARPDSAGVVRMTADDTMKYNATRIEVPAGAKAKVELKHVGQLPKDAMGHNFVVLRPGSDPQAIATKAAAAKANDYIPQGETTIIAHTRLLAGGEADTIEFELPGPGEYPFLCTFPGHVGLMRGVLVAK